ncbi:hypothetical protein [Flavobacterium gyeonganense]|uniref:Uncharacterized protein n=1 Tax=Flavobacterium gyeonganense TaxID=1310418 RepID=A0ABV5HC73_9FLAO|nr:hypothetical protein [Flavobacterium gyeonganense]
MAKKFRNNIIIGLPIIIFIISAILYYCSIINAEKSFIKLPILPNSKIELQEGNYNLYSLNLDSNIQKDLEVKAHENKKQNSLKISLLRKKRFIWSSQTTTMNGNVYNLLTNISISKKGNYYVSVQNPNKIKIQLVIQNQNDDATFLKSLLIYYLISIISLGVILIMLIVIIIKYLRAINKKKLI